MRVLAEHRGAVMALSGDGHDKFVSVGRDRRRFEIDLARGVARAAPMREAAQATEDDVRSAAPLLLPGARELVVSADGTAVLVRTTTPRDLGSLQAITR